MKSMTGYCRAQQENQLGSVSVEIKSVNSRFLDLQIRLPNELGSLDPEARQQIMKHVKRGKVTLSCRYDLNPDALAYELNEPLLDLLKAAVEKRGQIPDFSQLLKVHGVVLPRNDEKNEEALGHLFMSALKEALSGFNASRAEEGKSLKIALSEIKSSLKENLSEVCQRKENAVREYREKLQERLTNLLEGKNTTLDPARLEFEVSLLAEKSDLTEEIKRLESHLNLLADIIKNSDKTEGIGKRLEFLQQEIGREINTMASKTRDVEIVTYLLEMKRDSEKLKEQAANIE